MVAFWQGLAALVMVLACACVAQAPPASPAPVAEQQPRATPTPPSAPTKPTEPSKPSEPPYNYDDWTLDTDQDGLFDPEDRCPTEPGRRNREGCPTSWTEEPGGSRLVTFRPGSVELEATKSLEYFDEMLKVLVNARMCVEVTSFTLKEEPGAPLLPAERKLGVLRAEALRQLLVKKGLAAGAIRFLPNVYPREFLERGMQKEQFQDAGLVRSDGKAPCAPADVGVSPTSP